MLDLERRRAAADESASWETEHMTTELVLETRQPAKEERFAKGAIQIAQGATWFGLGIGVGSALEYLTQGLIAVRLGPDDFGIFNLGLRVTGIVMTLAILSMPGAVTYFIPRFKAQGESKQLNRLVSFSVWLTFLASLVVAGLLFVGAGPIANVLLREPRLALILRLFALTLPTSVLATVLVGNLRGLKRSREASLLTSTYERVIRLVFVVALFALGLGVQAPVLAFLPASIIVSVLGFYHLRKTGIRASFARPAGLSGEILQYTWPLLLSQLLSQTIPSIQPLLLSRFHDARAVGLYSIAWLIAPRLFGMIVGAFGFLYIPVISEVAGQGDTQGMRRLYRLVTKWQLIVILPSYLLMVTLPGMFLSLFGDQYGEATWALVVMATSMLASVSFGPVGATLLATGHTVIYLLLNLAGTLLGVMMGLLLIPSLGLLGAALAHLLTTAGWNGLTWLVVYRKYGIHPFDRRYLIIALISLASLAVLYPILFVTTNLTPWVLVIAAPLYTVLVAFALVKLRLLDQDSQLITRQFIELVLQKAEIAQVRIRQKIKEALENREDPGN